MILIEVSWCHISSRSDIEQKRVASGSPFGSLTTLLAPVWAQFAQGLFASCRGPTKHPPFVDRAESRFRGTLNTMPEAEQLAEENQRLKKELRCFHVSSAGWVALKCLDLSHYFSSAEKTTNTKVVCLFKHWGGRLFPIFPYQLRFPKSSWKLKE